MAPAKASDTLIYPWMGSQVVLGNHGVSVEGNKNGGALRPHSSFSRFRMRPQKLGVRPRFFAFDRAGTVSRRT
jgi:hypothetical protein